MADENKLIPDKLFSKIVSFSPLVSVDLVIENNNQEFLLGFRENRPAYGYWFVPGGRIRKNEKIHDTLDRILENEIGVSQEDYEVSFIGVFEHFYPDSVFEKKLEISTHYVAIAFQVMFAGEEGSVINDSQHSELKWFSMEDIIENEDVHYYCKEYFLNLHQ